MRATRLMSLFAGTLVALLLPAGASAAVQVTTTVDEQDGECALDCSLRDGVNIAGRTGDVVQVPGGTYTLALGPLNVGNATIQGAGAGVTIIRAGTNARVVLIISSSTITGVTITGGVTGFSGAGIEVGNNQVAMTLNLSESAVSGNASNTGSNGFGGGISVNSLATLVMTNTTVSGNRVQGGDGRGVGAGVYVNANGRAELRNSTVSSNIAEQGSSPGFGGGVGVEDAGTLVMENVTVAANTAGSAGGIVRDDDGFSATPPPAIAISDTIVAGNSAEQCSGIGAHSGDYNLSSDASCGFTATGDKQNTNPQLGPLQVNNGTGRTATHALPLGSPAINAGDPTTCKATDQRGAPRPAGGCDIGAFEYVAPTLRVITAVVNDNGGTLAPGNFSAHVRAGATDVNGSPQPGTGAGTTYTLNAGSTYTVAADAVAGYTLAVTGDCAANGSITLQENQARTCTITANDVAPTLRVITTVVNNSGGTAVASNFSAHVRQNGIEVSGSPQSGVGAPGTLYTLTPGTYAVTADGVAGYAPAGSGACNAAGSVTLVLGQAATCTITVDDIAPTLRVITNVVNDEGGTLAPANFTAHVRTGAIDVAGSPQPGSAAGSVYTLSGGQTYTVAADAVAGYSLAVTGTCAANGNITLALGQNATCTITATDNPPTLRVITNVVNDNGGTLAPGNFSAHVRAGATDINGSPQPGTTTGTLYTLSAGTYTVAADAVSGYSLSVSGDCAANGTITLQLDQDRSCTITANDVAPTLRVITTVVNNSGGTAVASNFSAHVRQNGTEVTGSPQSGVGAPGTLYTLTPGTYAVTADGVAGYAPTGSGACNASGSVTLALGNAVTCTITVDDGAGTLTVVTTVVNDDGGPADADAFDVSVRHAGIDVPASPQPGSENGTPYSLAAATYTVSAAGAPGYTFAVSGDCASDGSVTLPLAQARSCMVTANDVAPKLTVITQVVNDHGGGAAPGGFSVHVRRGGADVANSPQPGSGSGTVYTLAAGAHAVAADAVGGYSSAISGDCAADGSITLGVGDNRSCTVTANDDAPARGQSAFQQLPPPEARRTVNALLESGTVKVKLPGSSRYVDLDEARQLPVGTVVDARNGHVTLIAAADESGGTATAEFWAGIFRLTQSKGSAPTTILTLVEKLSCPRSGKASVAAKRKKKRRLWGDGSGKFQTKGKHSAATVVGTKWLVEDRCSSTLTRVVTGVVSVRDFGKRKTVRVRAGKKYVAKARRR